MEITKWDLYKQIDSIPIEQYPILKDYIDRLIAQDRDELILDKKSKMNFDHLFEEFSNGEYLSYEDVFEDGKKSNL